MVELLFIKMLLVFFAILIIEGVGDMKKVKSSTLIILILSVLLVILGGYIVYDKIFQSEVEVENDKLDNEDIFQSKDEAEKDKLSNEDNIDNNYGSNYTYNNVSGIYTGTDETEEAMEISYRLILFNDGTSSYCGAANFHWCEYGNYTIIDKNTISLNSWFQTGTDTSIKSLKESYVVNVDSNKLTISDVSNNITLVQTTTNIGVDEVTIYDALNHGQLVNELTGPLG